MRRFLNQSPPVSPQLVCSSLASRLPELRVLRIQFQTWRPLLVRSSGGTFSEISRNIARLGQPSSHHDQLVSPAFSLSLKFPDSNVHVQTRILWGERDAFLIRRPTTACATATAPNSTLSPTPLSLAPARRTCSRLGSPPSAPTIGYSPPRKVIRFSPMNSNSKASSRFPL